MSVCRGGARPALSVPGRTHHGEEPQQRCNLSLYSFPLDSAHSAVLPSVTYHSERASPNRVGLHQKKEAPRLRKPGRFG